MDDKEIFAEFTDTRFKALYDRIKQKQRAFFETTTEQSRDKDAGFEASTMFYMAFVGLHQDALLNEAVEEFDRIYPLWFPMPEIMKGLEHIRMRMLENYLKRENRDLSRWKTKVTKRLKILGFIPTRWPLQAKIFNEDGECVQIKKYEYDFTWENLSALIKAKTFEENVIAYNRLCRISIESTSPLRFEVISGEPTRKRFFHALVKFLAIRDFGNELRNSSAIDFELGKKIHTIAKDFKIVEKQSDANITIEKAEIMEDPFLGDHTRAQQAVGFYFLLKAAGIKAGLDNRTEFAKFLAVMSAYKVADGKSIVTTSLYSTLRQNMSGDKWFSRTDRELVMSRFMELNKKDPVELLTKAIELIRKDLESK